LTFRAGYFVGLRIGGQHGTFRYKQRAGCTDNTATVAKQVSERVAPVSAPQPAADSGLDEASCKPMTVFIDGPTGYTCFWSRERGWKFVGRLTERVQ
jgi:hypothetical protein